MLKSNAITVRVKLTIFATPPPVPVIVTREVPVVAVELAVNVTVEKQLGLQLAGENVAVTPVGRVVGSAANVTEVVDELSELGSVRVTIV